MSGKAWKDVELEKALTMREEGKSDEEIAKWLGRSEVAVRQKLADAMKQNGTFTEHRLDDLAEVSATVPRIMSDKDLLKFLQVDENEWRVTKVVYGKSEGYRKDRQVKWDVTDGKVTRGRVRDSGELLIKPLFSVKVFLERKVHEKKARNEIEELKKLAAGYAPRYKKIRYAKHKDPYMYEIAMPDLQLGRLVWTDEANHDSTPDLYIRNTKQAIMELLQIRYPLDQILFPIGNDFFNSNTADNKTAHGTPQRDDPRWQRTYKLAKSMMIEFIERMSTLAPVYIPVIKGNHDEERIFYFGDTLESWFHRNPNVTVDNRPKGRKYFTYGQVLIGFAHGYYEKIELLGSLMSYEVPDLWAASRFREWHLGDKHHKQDVILRTKETKSGVVVRTLRSLAPPSVWEYDKTLVASQKAAEGFLWHKDQGLKAQFTAAVM